MILLGRNIRALEVCVRQMAKLAALSGSLTFLILISSLSVSCIEMEVFKKTHQPYRFDTIKYIFLGCNSSN